MQPSAASIFPINSLSRLGDLLGVPPNDIKQLANVAGRYYKPFDIYKGTRADGSIKWRHIDNPLPELKDLQTLIYRKLLKPLAPELPAYLTGGMPKRSIIDNASFHIAQPAIVALDIENCFPSISDRRIFEVWRTDLGCIPEVAGLLTKLTTLQTRLPQGSPASPILCNLALRPLADDINSYAAGQGLQFSIYVDDVTLSGDAQLVRVAISPVIKLVAQRGYRLNRQKILIMDANELQRVTGITTNQTPTIQRQKIQAIRQSILDVAAWQHSVTATELNSMWGKIQHVKNVAPNKGEKLEHLAQQLIGDTVGQPTAAASDKVRKCKSTRRKH
jgi:retron-type reverse transcriptase